MSINPEQCCPYSHENLQAWTHHFFRGATGSPYTPESITKVYSSPNSAPMVMPQSNSESFRFFKPAHENWEQNRKVLHFGVYRYIKHVV